MVKKININKNKVRSVLYTTAQIIGDIIAIKNGKFGKRLARRAAGKLTDKVLTKLFK